MRGKSILTQFLLYLLFLAVVCPAATGEIIYVDDDGSADFDTIQAVIDDANDGDTVLVAAGTYTGDGNRDIDFAGKAITVKSENGPQTCIIDCQGSEDDPHRGFYFHSGEEANSVIEGFTITGGYITRYASGGRTLHEKYRHQWRWNLLREWRRRYRTMPYRRKSGRFRRRYYLFEHRR